MKIKSLIKLVFSCLISFGILNGICFFFYNVPVHSESETGSTDYVWEKNKFYSRGTEGFAWGKTDSNGFNNISSEHSIKPEVLIMGTSHTEALNVLQNESYAYRFNELSEQNGMELDAYNIGISGHNITICLNNFESALEEFEPSKYVVMEVTTTELTENEINQVLNSTVKTIHSSANPILVFLQKIPFLRRVYSQIDNLGVEVKSDNNGTEKERKTLPAAVQSADDKNNSYEDALNTLLERIGKAAESKGIKLIIVHHSKLQFDESGNVIPQLSSEKSEIFKTVCSRNGIEIFDMYDAFAEYYNETHRLPYGFINTAVGVGHLNKYGHKVIADELFKLIAELENQASVVK